MYGFDIGTCNLKIAQWDGGQLKRLVSAEVPENLVKDGVITSYEAMADFIKFVAKQNKLTGKKDAAVVIAPGLAFLRRTTMPAMTANQLSVNLPYEFRDYLTADKSKYFYDYLVNFVKYDDDENPVEMDLTTAAILKETINEYTDMFRRAGFKLKTAIPAECAYANILGAKEIEDISEFAFLDFGHCATRLTIFTGSVYETSRSMETGLLSVDKAISDFAGVDVHIANSYKVSNYEGIQESEAAKNVYSEIALETRKAVNFYSFNNRESDLKDVFCGGGGWQVEPLRESIGEAVDLNMHSVNELLPPISKNVQEDNCEAYVLAIGAAMQKEGK